MLLRLSLTCTHAIAPHLQATEEYYVCAWSLDVASGAPLLLLAGRKGLLLAVNALTGALEVSGPRFSARAPAAG